MTAPSDDATPPLKPTPKSSPRIDRVPAGIGYMIAATVLFSLSNALSKLLVETYPVGEVLFLRTLASLVGVLAVVLPVMGWVAFRTAKPRAHLIRGTSQATSQTMILIAFSLLPLASVVAIAFAAPLFATLASAIFLKETVGRMRWMALVVGFLGVLIITQPGSETFSFGALLALGNAVLYGSVTAGVRGMTATESTETLMLYQMTILTIVFAALLAFGWRTPTPFDGMLLVVNGVANALGQYWWTRALFLAPASAVGPFYYFMLIWAIGFGFVIWGDVPTLALLAGSAVVVASGLFLLWYEARRAPKAG